MNQTEFAQMIKKQEERAKNGHLAALLREQVDQLEAAHVKPLKELVDRRDKDRKKPVLCRSAS